MSMGFSSQENWSGFPFSSPGDRPNPGMEPRSPTLQADTLLSEPPGLRVLRNSGVLLVRHGLLLLCDKDLSVLHP